MQHAYYKSPVGSLLLVGDTKSLTELRLPAEAAKGPPSGSTLDQERFTPEIKELAEYFAGSRKEFSIPLSPSGTAFQKEVWKQLQQIEYGRTVSYQEVAEEIDNPKAYRAVGMANNKNPIAIIIPCHRVIGKDGGLAGYGGGLELKKRLLDLEKEHCQD